MRTPRFFWPEQLGGRRCHLLGRERLDEEQVWEECLEFGVRHVKFEMPSGLTSKWKCQGGSEIFEAGAQARGQR